MLETQRDTEDHGRLFGAPFLERGKFCFPCGPSSAANPQGHSSYDSAQQG